MSWQDAFRQSSGQSTIKDYTTDELIQELGERELNNEQALELEDMLLAIPDPDPE